MLTIDDFWKILKFLESGQASDPTIDQNLTALAQSEKSKTTDFFEKILDIKPFLSEDYGRLRKFLIDWYSSHKTLVTTQKQISDVFSLPEESLSELIQGFGYTSPIETLSFDTKINFFLDLVNLYKVKGTPLALERVLTYFGLNNIQLVEFWLMRDSSGELIFRPEIVTSTITDPSITSVTLADITFEEMVGGDPHWMLTRDQIEQSLLVNAIGIPSISPYFSVYGYVNLTELLKYIPILVRKVQDEYQSWLVTHTTPDEIVLKLFKESSTSTSIKIVVSVLEVYLASIYLWNLMNVATGGESRYICYDGTSTNLVEIFALYDSLLSRTYTRLETKQKYETFMSVFTRVASTNFLINKDTAGAVLNLINPSLKTELDSWTSSEERTKNAIVYLLNELTAWCQQNISKFFPNLANITLGIDASQEVTRAINFFKPYRARLRAINIANIQKNPALDSLITEDRWPGEKVIETIVDFDTADSLPGVLPDWIPIGPNVTSNPPIGSRRISNLYVDSSFVVKAVSSDATSLYSIDILSTPPAGAYRIVNVYLEDIAGPDPELVVIYNSIPEPIGGISTNIESEPPYSLVWPFEYLIYEMNINPIGDISITYNTTHSALLSDPGKKYYPRNTYDTGSWFDIGISCDDPPRGMDSTAVIWLGEDFVRRIPREPGDPVPYYKDLYPETSSLFRPVVDFYCGHPTDATAYVDIYHEPGSFPISEPTEWYTDGGFYNIFDQGGYFDQPFPSDICYIVNGVQLQVESINPLSGVPAEISKIDVYGNSDGNTEAIRVYPLNLTMSISVPLSFGGNPFSKWTLDGVDYSLDNQISILTDDNHMLTAIFGAAPPPPAIYSVFPNFGPSTGGTFVTVTGANFLPSASVSFDSILVDTTFINSTTLTCTTSAYNLPTGGLVDVSVTQGTGVATLYNAFTFTSILPIVDSLDLNSGCPAGGTYVTITGENFITGDTVSFGGIGATNVIVVNPTTITCDTPVHSSGVVDVSVTYGIYTGTLPGGFTYYTITLPIITYVTQQMIVSGTQNLSNDSGGNAPYTWSTTFGSLAKVTTALGENNLFTAPSSNLNCANNPTITVTDCCGSITTLKIAVNQATLHPLESAVQVYTLSNIQCNPLSANTCGCTRQCPVYNCDGALLTNGICGGGICNDTLLCTQSYPPRVCQSTCSPVYSVGDFRSGTTGWPNNGCCPVQLLEGADCIY